MMLVNPICGFLGSGKTTLMRRILGERGGAEPMAVIVNEFGAVGIDGALLEGTNVNMIEITAGCLCCTLKGSLVTALEELRDTRGVKRVVIEATGVAQPGELLEVLSEPALRGSVEVGPVVTVVDSAKFSGLRRVLGSFYAEQVQRADVVILNKTDLTDPSRLDEVRRTIAGLNPKAAVVAADHCNVELDMVLDGQRRAPEPSALEQGLASPAPAASFVSFVVPAAFDSSRAAVEQFFASLPPEIMRAKGFMKIDGQLATVQFAAGQLEITPAAGSRPLTMVFISNAEPNRTAIAEAFGRTKRS
jgi:G3E family GTPase